MELLVHQQYDQSGYVDLPINHAVEKTSSSSTDKSKNISLKVKNFHNKINRFACTFDVLFYITH